MPASVTSPPYRHAPASRASAKPAAAAPARPAASAADLRERMAKLEAGIATLKGLTGLHAADAALAKGDTDAARRALSDPTAYEAYHARLRGECYAAPVAVAKAEPDHRTRIRKFVADGAMDALTGLMRAAPAADRQYREMTWSGELAEAAVEGKTRRAVAAAGSRGHAPVAKKMPPADVPEAEKVATARRIRVLLAQRDTKGLDAVRRTVAGQAAWTAMARAGEVAP